MAVAINFNTLRFGIIEFLNECESNLIHRLSTRRSTTLSLIRDGESVITENINIKTFDNEPFISNQDYTEAYKFQLINILCQMKIGNLACAPAHIDLNIFTVLTLFHVPIDLNYAALNGIDLPIERNKKRGPQSETANAYNKQQGENANDDELVLQVTKKQKAKSQSSKSVDQQNCPKCNIPMLKRRYWYCKNKYNWFKKKIVGHY
ncbi:hypothetical protein BpHYR1_032726 [Brachionus plicatilis]|uniref:Uncharacterized protein n=1 Tax=Brachionus plicatilis TaxID=10195 RepID=A0A3M7SJ31_BRAPC|nr:hypothetical protein BpHYR1_032726 [Brachionus plicatilis]